MRREKYRAYPTVGQVWAVNCLFGCVRKVWNLLKEHADKVYEEKGSSLSRKEQSAFLTYIKHTPEYSYLCEVSSVPLQQVVNQYSKAMRGFFDSWAGKRKGLKIGRPRFKKRRTGGSAVFTRAAGSKICYTSRRKGRVYLPKIGWLDFVYSRPLPAAPSSVTLIREADATYYVSFVVEAEPYEPLPPTDSHAGIDLGLTDLATIVTSTGTVIKTGNERWYRRKEAKLRRQQKALARKKKGSQNRKKAVLAVARTHAKIRHQRQDYLRKLAHRVVSDNQTITLETLTSSSLTKTRLGKSVHDASWTMLTRFLEEAASKHGRTITYIDRWFPSTKLCTNCGVINDTLALSDRTWTCDCGITHDRDINAAYNLLVAAGHADTLNACGEHIRPESLAEFDETRTHRNDPNHDYQVRA